MSAETQKYLVTGANGQLGRLAVESLIKKVPASQVVALVRKPEAKNELAALGIDVRVGSYDSPESLDAALAGIDSLLLVSSSEVGRRVQQHLNVINAAKKAGVTFIAYTSILHADTTPAGLAVEHKATEQALAESGVAYALLRNSWYTENYLASVGPALEHGAVAGAAGAGRISAASRADYAEAAAVVLINATKYNGKTLELAGDEAFTMADVAAILSEFVGKPIAYADMPEAAYAGLLTQAGLPSAFAAALADADVAVSKNALFNDSRVLSGLIGRPTTSVKETLSKAFQA